MAPRKSQGVRYSIERVPESVFGLGRVDRRFFMEALSGARITARDPRDSAAAWRASRASVTGTRRTWIVIGDDFEFRLAGEGSKDDRERFFVKDQSDRAPALSDPKPDPC